MDLAAIVRAIGEADGSPDDLHDLFALLVSRYGRTEASRLWWAAFAARDATET